MSGIDRFLPDLLVDAALLLADGDQMEAIVQSHLALRDTDAGGATCALSVPASAVPHLRDVVDPDRDLLISLYGDTGLDGLVAARDQLQDDAWITIDHVVLPLPAPGPRAAQTREALDALAFTVPTHLELPIDDQLDVALAVIAEDGVERAAFSAMSADALADAIVAAVRHSVPFSITTGAPGNEAHGRPGVVSLLAATARAIDSDDTREVAELLRTDEVTPLLSLLKPDRAGVVRRHLHSVSCTSVSDAYNAATTIGGTQ